MLDSTALVKREIVRHRTNLGSHAIYANALPDYHQLLQCWEGSTSARKVAPEGVTSLLVKDGPTNEELQGPCRLYHACVGTCDLPRKMLMCCLIREVFLLWWSATKHSYTLHTLT